MLILNAEISLTHNFCYSVHQSTHFVARSFECSRMYLSVPEYTRVYLSISEYIRVYPSVPEYPECIRVHPNHRYRVNDPLWQTATEEIAPLVDIPKLTSVTLIIRTAVVLKSL